MKLNDLYLILLVFALFSCNTKEWSVDHAILYEDSNGASLVVLEDEYTIVSKTTSGGSEFTGGYSTFHLTSYDPATGKPFKTLLPVDKLRKSPSYITTADQQVWYYACNELGLHGRDPFSLEITTSKDDILKANPTWTDRFIDERDQYVFPISSGREIGVLSASAKYYALSPSNLQFTRLGEEPEKPHPLNPTRYQLSVPNVGKLSFSGDPLARLQLNRTLVTPSIELIEPSFLAAQQEGAVFVLSNNGIGEAAVPMVSCLQVGEGVSIKWSVMLNDIHPEGKDTDDCLLASIASNTLVMGFPKNIYGINPETGSIKWRKVYE